MEISSKHQLTVFLICVISGMGCALFFDIQRSFRRMYSAGKIRTTAEDVLFAVVVTSALIGLGFYFNRGQMRYYQCMGALSGSLFYAAFLSNTAMKFMAGLGKIIIRYFVNPLIKTVFIILWPVRKAGTILKTSAIRIKRVKKRVTGHIRTRGKFFKKRMKML